jgi:hypothetical protein
MNDWNGVSGSALHYGLVFNDGSPNRYHTINRVNFSSAGFPTNIPGAATRSGFVNGRHQYSHVYLNSLFSWNTVGTMNESLNQADVHTVAMHEVGHSSGLNHPSVCGPMTTAEVAAAMNPNWQKKWNLNSDDQSGLDGLY